MEYGIKFYSKSDLGSGYNLKKIEEYFSENTEEKESYKINEILELFNILKYIENECYLVKWNKEYIQFLKNKKTYINSIIGRFCSNIENLSLENVDEVDNQYWRDYIEIYNKYKIYNKISAEEFGLFISKRWVLIEVLKFKEIVKKYGTEIKNEILKNPENSIIFLDKYEYGKTEYNIPIEITQEEKEKLIIKYIEMPTVNPNHLKVISRMNCNKDTIIVADKTKLIAKKRYDEIMEDMSKNAVFCESGVSVELDENTEESSRIEIYGRVKKNIISAKWIKENLDYATLLNNFIYLFEYVDSEFRISSYSKKEYMSIFEKTLFNESVNSYKKGVGFDMINNLQTLQMLLYYNFLNTLGVRIEEIIEWFFKEYLLNEFKIENYSISLSSANTKIIDKCRNVAGEMESILKQYNLYVKENEINHELINITTESLAYEGVKTLVHNKYVYGESDEFRGITHWFFSDQSDLAYVKNGDEKYKNFYNLVIESKRKKEEFHNYQIQIINKLLDLKYLEEDNDGILTIAKKKELKIFKDLYINEVISYWKYSKKYRVVIEELVNKKILSYKNDTLLSIPEIKYYNYVLNNKEFNNGLELRNKYIHGSYYRGQDEENVHMQNYMILLKLFILIIIKINDDLEIYNSKEYEENNKKC